MSVMTKQFTGTKEWARKTVNVCLGCPHNCEYCYAKGIAIRFGRATADSWKQQTLVLARLPKVGRCKPTRIMFPSTHDITPENLGICVDALERMLARGHQVLVVSKPHVACIREICERFPAFREKLVFRFTIGSSSNEVLKIWEPNAPAFEERLASLELAYAYGYQTSVSCEPMLDTQIELVVQVVEKFVTDTIWIGIMNDVKRRLKVNKASPEIQRMGEELMKSCSREMIGELYDRLKGNPKIRWKDSIKKMLGLERPTAAGLDI